MTDIRPDIDRAARQHLTRLKPGCGVLINGATYWPDRVVNEAFSIGAAFGYAKATVIDAPDYGELERKYLGNAELGTGIYHPDNQPKLARIADAIRDYHFALDIHTHGGVAANLLLQKLEQILDMPWRQGQEKQRQEQIYATDEAKQ